MDYWADTQVGFDGAVVQYSTDGGASWEAVGDGEGAGINWYNFRNLGSAPGGENRFAWSSMDNGWSNARYNLDQIPHSQRDKVVFRVAFASNNDNPSGRVLEGFAFDNIYIGEKKRNVLIEDFVNDGIVGGALDELYDKQTDIGQATFKKKSDFTKIEYHLNTPSADPLYADDMGARAFYYGVDNPPYTIMDGILGDYFDITFNGQLAKITVQEIDRRALEDPLFYIKIDTIHTSDNVLKADLKIKYIDSLKTLENNVIVHVALMEANIGAKYRNVVRKLLPQSEGELLLGPWTIESDTARLSISYPIDVPIENPEQLYLVAFVQNKGDGSGDNDTRIHQSNVVKAPKKVGREIVGLPDDPSTAEIENIRIYPNPAKNYINFELDNKLARDYTWQLVDQRGITVLAGDLRRDLTSAQRVDISTVANGVYYVVVGTKNATPIYRKVAVFNGN
jgi:hypothetical protein